MTGFGSLGAVPTPLREKSSLALSGPALDS
jgi:hypothetical protein